MKYRIVEEGGIFTVQERFLSFWCNIESSNININANTIFPEGVTSTFNKEDAMTLLTEYIKLKTKIIHKAI